MMKYIFLDGPFKMMVIKTRATLDDLNSKPDIPIEFITGPLEGLVTRSIICYDRKIRRASEAFKEPKETGVNYSVSNKVTYYG